MGSVNKTAISQKNGNNMDGNTVDLESIKTAVKMIFGPIYRDVHFADEQTGTLVGAHFALKTTNNALISNTTFSGVNGTDNI